MLSVFEHGDVVELLNEFYYPVTNWFFRFWSAVGNGWFSVVVILAMIPFNKKKFIVLATNSVLCAVLAQFFKRVVFSDIDRPLKVLGREGHNLIEGIHIASKHSFPSGHTTAAFALFIMLALMFENKRASFLFFFASVLVGLGRVYLFEHFYVDTYAGAILGSTVTVVVYYLFSRSQKFKEHI